MLRPHPLAVFALTGLLTVLTVSHGAAQTADTVTQDNSTCVNCDMTDAVFTSGSSLAGANFTGADLQDVTISGVAFTSSSFASANLTDADLSGSSFDASQTGLATSFDGANLSQANLSGATADGASFLYADLSCADFSNADMRGAAFGLALTGFGAAGAECVPTVSGAQFSCDTYARAPWLAEAGAAAPEGCVPTTTLAAQTSGLDWSCPDFDPSTISQAVYVSSGGSDGDSCGAASGSACQTIQAGINACTGTDDCGILVEYGAYTPGDTLTFPENKKTLVGGCTASGGTESDRSQVTSAGGARVMKFNANANITVRNFILKGSAAGGTGGAAYVAITLVAQSTPNFVNLSIMDGQGAPGADGTPSTAGQTGDNGDGQDGGGTCNGWTGGDGGDGETTNFSDGKCHYSCKGQDPSDCAGHNGTGPLAGTGAAFTHITNACKVLSCPSGKYGATGGNGDDGICGANGVPATSTRGTLDGTSWAAVLSGPGTAGESGGPGGGGSGGSACSHTFSEYNGGHGGGGAAGGCGATDAGGGQMGGAWIGINIAQDSAPTFDNVVITGGRGGDGGDGADGGKAAPGGSGGAAGSGSNDNSGGGGGSGGWGGSSGAGAGGNGGPVINILFAGMSETTITGVQHINGTGGKVGAGGQPASNPSGAPCSPTDAAPPGESGAILTVVSIQ